MLANERIDPWVVQAWNTTAAAGTLTYSNHDIPWVLS